MIKNGNEIILEVVVKHQKEKTLKMTLRSSFQIFEKEFGPG